MRTITSTFSTVLHRLRTTPAAAEVHFHGGTAGPYVCDDVRCESPGLALSEA